MAPFTITLPLSPIINTYPPSSITIAPNSLDSAIIYSRVWRMGVANALFDQFINIKFHIKIHFYISSHSLHQILSCLISTESYDLGASNGEGIGP